MFHKFTNRVSGPETPRGRTGLDQTPQVPPNPIVTLPPSTITGTWRLPRENSSMRVSAAASFLTLKY
jgi:hypothetical protein